MHNPGDKVRCLREGLFGTFGFEPIKGNVYEVVSIGEYYKYHLGPIAQCTIDINVFIRLDDGSVNGWHCTNFELVNCALVTVEPPVDYFAITKDICGY